MTSRPIPEGKGFPIVAAFILAQKDWMRLQFIVPVQVLSSIPMYIQPVQTKVNNSKEIIDLIDEQERMSVCIDTAHIFAAGYDIVNDYENIIKEFDDIIGLSLLKCFHINDSKKELGSRVDRHEHIGKGFIGLKGFENIMNDDRLNHIPKILETPKGKDQKEDIINLNVLRSLIKKRTNQY